MSLRVSPKDTELNSRDLSRGHNVLAAWTPMYNLNVARLILMLSARGFIEGHPSCVDGLKDLGNCDEGTWTTKDT